MGCQQGEELVFGQNGDAGLSRLVRLGARLLSDDNVGCLSSDRRGYCCTEGLHPLAGLAPSHRGERTGEHKPTAIERTIRTGSGSAAQREACGGQGLQHRLVLGVVEEGDHGLRGQRADLMDRGQLLFVGGCKAID